MDVRAVLVMLAVLMPLLQASGETVNVNLNIGGNTGRSGVADKSQGADNIAEQLKQVAGLFQDFDTQWVTSQLEPQLLDMSDIGQNMVIAKLLEQNKEMQGHMQEMQQEIKSLKIDNCITKTTCCNKTLEGCPSGYERFCEKPDMCYKISTGDKNYTEARSACLAAGGRLAMPKDKATNDILVKIKAKAKCLAIWIGLTDEVTQGIWVWQDGTKLGWDNWGPGLPTQYNRNHYAVHTTDGTWFDLDGMVTYRYICEVKATVTYWL